MTPTPHNDDTHPFTPYLQPGEELLWVGRPNREVYPVMEWRRHIRRVTALTVVFVIFTAGLALDSIFTPSDKFAEAFAFFCGLFAIFTAAWLIFLKLSRPRLNEYAFPWYAVSNKRVMGYTDAGDLNFSAILFAKIRWLMLIVTSDGNGTVTFSYFASFNEVLRFVDIDAAREVCEQIQAAAGRDIPLIEKR